MIRVSDASLDTGLAAGEEEGRKGNVKGIGFSFPAKEVGYQRQVIPGRLGYRLEQVVLGKRGKG